jgi:Tfp pilus assembly protein PilN
MADIDMIPRAYRDALRVRRTATAYGTALALLLVAGGGASAVLRWRVAVETPRLEQLRAGSVRAEAMRAQLAAAQARRDAWVQDAAALAALRGTGEVAALANILDTALNEQVWIEQLRFSRTAEQLASPPPSPLPPGTVQARAAQAAGAAAPLQPWRLGSRLDINGKAHDHAAMASFLAAMAANPGLADVRFMNSSAAASGADNPANPQTADGAVSFGAAASLVKHGEAR